MKRNFLLVLLILFIFVSCATSNPYSNSSNSNLYKKGSFHPTREKRSIRKYIDNQN